MRANEDAAPRLGDGDIRVQLNLWLEDKFSYDPTTVVYPELAIPRPSSRIDIAVANGVLAGFEIKSDLDSLNRLPRQIASFSKVFEHITLVTTATHLDKAQVLLPDCWGILLVGGEKIRTIKRAKINKGVSGEHALYLLTCAELLYIIGIQGIRCSSHEVKSSLISAILKRMSLKGIMLSVREALKLRSIQVDRRNHQVALDT